MPGVRHAKSILRPPDFSRLCVLLIAALFAVPPVLAQAAVEGDETARVRKVLEEIIAADNSANVERIVALYEEDALLLPPAGPAVVGKDAIKERYRQGFEKAKLEVAFHSEETHVTGDWAFDRGLTRGRNVWRDGRAPTKFEHKYLMILRRRPDGGWKIARLIWNNNSTE